MRTCDVIVKKLIYQNKSTAYTIFEGVVLRKNKKTGQFTPTKEIHTFVGYFFCLFPGDHIEVQIMEIFNKTYGSQYAVIYSKRIEPGTAIEIRAFLQKNIKGMTAKRADKLMDKYGLDAIHAVKTDPHALDFLGLGPDDFAELREALLKNAAFENVIIFCQRMGLDCRHAQPLYAEYGENTEQLVQGNPYLPYLDGIFDFKTSDKLYLDLGLLSTDSKRCLYTTLATLRMDTKQYGNVFTKRDELRGKMSNLLVDLAKGQEEGCPFNEPDISAAIDTLAGMNLLFVDKSFGCESIYLTDNYNNERSVTQDVIRLMTEPKKTFFSQADISSFLINYELNTAITLANAQKDAVKTALTSPITIISGGPGTGKTQTINTIMAAIRAMAPGAVIRACAPTGKASVRISELTGVPAGTIHRMLGLGNFKGFMRAGELTCDFLFVDEFSMTDIELCAKLFDAIEDGARVVIVGDHNQLPSVGPGLVLRDFIASGVIPTVILNHVFRQAGTSRIITNAHRIINQTPGDDISLRIAKKPGEDFYFIQENDPRKILNLIIKSIDKCQSAYGYNSKTVQVLSPIKRGDLGTENLNYVLQQKLNQTGLPITIDDKELRLGDKVIHTTNNYKLAVFNGEVGFITDMVYKKDHALTVSYPDRDVIYSIQDICELELAYSLTVHKVQGSEYPVIIMPVHESMGIGLSKSILFTALTRAKKMVILIGSAKAMSDGLRRETSIERESHLMNRIQNALLSTTNTGGLPL